MTRRSSLRSVIVVVAVMTMIAAGSGYTTIGDIDSGPIDVFDNTAEFVAMTGATQIPWVTDADAALPSKPFGAGLLDYSCDMPGLVTPGGAATVVNPSGNWICYIGAGWNAAPGNTDPQPTGPTIVNNGEDDYAVTISFGYPAHAVGLGLLTNAAANETVTLVFSDGDELVVDDADLGTVGNSFEFVGFRSVKPIAAVRVDTTGGATQNEGITGIWTSPFYVPPTTSCPTGQYFVSSVGTGTATPVVSLATAAGYPYELSTSGTYFAGGDYRYDIQADAEYSQDAIQRLNLLPWSDLVNRYESSGEGLLEMMVDGGFVEWGAFSDAHTYSMDHIATGSTIDFQIYDIYAQNNTGGLCVEAEAIALRSISGGGQIIAESFEPKDKHPYKVSFGGHIDDIDGGLVCEWQVNLHNVEGSDLDKAKFHASTCTEMNTWPPNTGGADGVANFTAQGAFNGETGYTAIFRMEDYTEPGAMDTFRITITGPGGFMFDTYDGAGGDFPGDSNNIGTARTMLDNGNIQIGFYE